MKKTTSILIFTLLAATLCLATCDIESTGTIIDSFSYDLRGTWISNEPIYPGLGGTLEIDFNFIKITGYSGSVPIEVIFDENKRPFKGFTKNVSLRGYSEKTKSFTSPNYGHEGTIFINELGKEEITAINYKYFYDSTSYLPKWKILQVSYAGWSDELMWVNEE